MDNIQKKVNKISGDIELYDEIKSGPISKIYSCNFNNINSIIRFDLPLASKLKLDRKKEITILKKISSLNLSPHILYKNYHEGILIWEYIPGVELSISNNQDFILQDLGRVLKKIHQIKLPKKLIKNFNESLFSYKELLHDLLEEKLIRKGFTLYSEICNEDDPCVFSHNDLNKTNLLFSNKIYFLDWEYASFNSPYFDIASLIASFNLNKEETNILLEGYSRNSFKINLEKLKKWVIFTYYLDYLWRKSIVQLDNSYHKSMKLDKIEQFLLNL